MVWRMLFTLENYRTVYGFSYFCSTWNCVKLRILPLVRHRHYSVSPKNVSDIFDCNLITNYRILIIFGTNISDTTFHQMTVQLVPALSGENNQQNITFYQMRYDCLINITRKNTFCSHFWHFGWEFFYVSIFSTACSKIARSVGQLCEHRQKDAFSIYWQQYW